MKRKIMKTPETEVVPIKRLVKYRFLYPTFSRDRDLEISEITSNIVAVARLAVDLIPSENLADLQRDLDVIELIYFETEDDKYRYLFYLATDNSRLEVVVTYKNNIRLAWYSFDPLNKEINMNLEDYGRNYPETEYPLILKSGIPKIVNSLMTLYNKLLQNRR